ncbi:PLD nuclease N-terminal domain-containing protein [Trueperella sp. LYQ141]|uniref:PLD nuclease N-terminal domain-containing protein n=1 Tax=Trueperella sp. LYQ141 TaxID=3391058 RepID=UPI0039834A6E
MNGFDSLTALPREVQIAIGILFAIQLVLLITAFIVMARTPPGPIAGAAKPVWALIIIFGQAIGPLLFLILSRRDARARSEYEQPRVRQMEPRMHSDSDSGITTGSQLAANSQLPTYTHLPANSQLSLQKQDNDNRQPAPPHREAQGRPHHQKASETRPDIQSTIDDLYRK